MHVLKDVLTADHLLFASYTVKFLTSRLLSSIILLLSAPQDVQTALQLILVRFVTQDIISQDLCVRPANLHALLARSTTLLNASRATLELHF